MWTLLSFTGRFDVAYLEDALARGKKNPPTMPGEKTEQKKQEVLNAQMARAKFRRGAMLERLHEKVTQGNYAKGESSGSGGAFQPAESNADASQPGGLPTVYIGCFNCGIDQYMLTWQAEHEPIDDTIS